jgi:N-acetylmuramoyl-L-alanine amidase
MSGDEGMAGRGALLAAVTVLCVACAATPAFGAGDDQSLIARTLVARTVYFEARSDGARGMLAVAFVIRNRLRAGSFGDTVAEVVRSPAQFSVWNRGGAARRGKVPADDPHWRQALQAARLAMAGAVKDPSRGATFYHEKSIGPAWSRSMRVTARVGSHVFLR